MAAPAGGGGGALDEGTKAIVPFLKRAEEIAAVDPLMAYYCRMYAMDAGMAGGAERGLLLSVVKQLEKDKTALQAGGKLGSREEDALHCEGFSLAVFGRAVKVDAAGKATATTAKAFLAAARFFEVLLHFGELREDIQEKMKFAAWKAADIQQALREGRRPTPGGVAPKADDVDAGLDGAELGGGGADALDAALDLPPPMVPPAVPHAAAASPAPPTAPAAPAAVAPPAPPPAAPTHYSPAAHYQAPAAPPAAPLPQAAAAPPPTAVPGYTPNRRAMDEAQKACRVAVSALGFDDVESAVESLHKALGLLTRP